MASCIVSDGREIENKLEPWPLISVLVGQWAVVKLAPIANPTPAVTNHGIPESLVSEFFEQQHAFFRLPLDQKMSIVQDENNRWAASRVFEGSCWRDDTEG